MEGKSTESHLGRGDLEEFGGDAGLAGLVVFESEILDESLGVVGRTLHGDHSGALLRGPRVEDHLVDREVEVVGKDGVENLV